MQLLWGGLRCIPQSALQGYGSRSAVRILILNKGLPLQPGIAMQRTKREHKTQVEMQPYGCALFCALPRGTRLNIDHRNKVDEATLQEAYILVAKEETGEYGRTTDEVVLGFFRPLLPPCFIHNRLYVSVHCIKCSLTVFRSDFCYIFVFFFFFWFNCYNIIYSSSFIRISDYLK